MTISHGEKNKDTHDRGYYGREACDLIMKYDSSVKSLFMSGYTDDIIHKRNILDRGVNFIEKPIVPDMLLRKIRDILDSGNGDRKTCP